MKTFKQFIAESPYGFNEINKDYLPQFNDDLENLKNINLRIMRRRRSFPIINNGNQSSNFFRTKTSFIAGGNIFFHKKEEHDPTSFVVVKKDRNFFDRKMPSYGKYVLNFMHKNGGSDSDLHQNIRNAIDHHGELYTDNQHSPGAVNFHMNFHKNFPDMEMHHITPDGKETIVPDREYLEKNKSNIWGTTQNHFRTMLRIRRKTAV